MSVSHADVGDWEHYPADEIEHADDDVELDLAILEGRREPFRPVPVRRPNRVASAAGRRRYKRASSRRRTLKLWSALRTCRRGPSCPRRRSPRARRRAVRVGVGDDADGPRARLICHVPPHEAKHAGRNAFRLSGTSAKIVPCPAETSDTTFVRCRLCLDADKLLERDVAIAFEAHGNGKKAVTEKPVQLRSRADARASAGMCGRAQGVGAFGDKNDGALLPRSAR